MSTEQERADFEAWYQHHHGDRDVYVLDESGEYADKQVQGAFNVWQARAALQSQDRDVVPYRCVAQAAHGLLGSEQYERLMEAIDHARRIEGDE